MRKYLARFEDAVFTLLGGLDMAEEFLALHPEVGGLMVRAAMYHHNKGGAIWKGAAVFFRFTIKPLLRKDKQLAECDGRR